MNTDTFDPYVFEERKIAGVTILSKHLPWAPCIHIQLSFAAGAFQDPLGKEGAAHFLEHMMSNGSPLLPNRKAVKDFSRLYTLNSRNAFTSFYRTAYHAKCLPEHFNTLITHMVDYVFRPFLRAEDVEHERRVIIQEAWSRFKNEKLLAYAKDFIINLYHDTPFGRMASPLGWPETVAVITQEDIAAFHKKHYVKENLTIFLVGNLEGVPLTILEELLSNIPSGQASKLEATIPSKPLELRKNIDSKDIGDPREQVELTLMSKLAHPTEKLLATTIQTSALLYDLLFEHLRTEHPLCYGVQTKISPAKEFFEMGISVDTSEDKLARAEEEVYKVVERIQSGEARDRFVTMHKVTIDQIRSNERLSDQVIQNASNDMMYWGRVIPLNDMLTMMGNVSYEDVSGLVEQFFDKEILFTEIIHPSK